MKKYVVFLLAFTLLFVSVLYAHDTYVIKEGNSFVVMHGHTGKHEPYNPQFIKAPKAYDGSGKEIPVKMKPEESRVLLDISKTPALVTFIYATGPRVKTAEGWKSLSKREAKGAIESKKWAKSVKQINSNSDRMRTHSWGSESVSLCSKCAPSQSGVAASTPQSMISEANSLDTPKNADVPQE